MVLLCATILALCWVLAHTRVVDSQAALTSRGAAGGQRRQDRGPLQRREEEQQDEPIEDELVDSPAEDPKRGAKKSKKKNKKSAEEVSAGKIK